MLSSASFSKRRATSPNVTRDPPYSQDDVVLDRDTISSPDVGDHNPRDATHRSLGRHLGLFSTTMLVVGRVIGTGIFSTPAAITKGVGSVGAALALWTLGLLVSFAGLMVWIELGCMIPRSGGEKVYLEAAYQRPKLFATTVFAFQAILLGFSGKSQASNSEVDSIQTDTSIQLTDA
jgi:amino acid permease